jgi:hypothetical protein
MSAGRFAIHCLPHRHQRLPHQSGLRAIFGVTRTIARQFFGRADDRPLIGGTWLSRPCRLPCQFRPRPRAHQGLRDFQYNPPRALHFFKRRATKKCLTGKAGLCFREGLRELHNFRRHYSEGPSDCRRAVLRISESLLSFAGECSQPQITTNFNPARASATRPDEGGRTFPQPLTPAAHSQRLLRGVPVCFKCPAQAH